MCESDLFWVCTFLYSRKVIVENDRLDVEDKYANVTNSNIFDV